MKKSNIIIFVVILLVVVAIFGYALWDANRELDELKKENAQQEQTVTDVNSIENGNDVSNLIDNTNTVGQATPTDGTNSVIDPNTNGTSTDNGNMSSGINYVGDWYISQEAYTNAEEIDRILDRREDNLITDEEFQSQMNSSINTNIAELDVERYTGNQIRFDFTLTSPAPTQREAKLDDIMVNLTNGIGTFTYTDNWGTSGNGTITLKNNQIELKLETTSAAQGALWGLEGIYTFSYKRID